MAIGVGSIVSPKRIGAGGATAGIMLNVQGPVFGISESAGTPFTILWSDGQRVASIPDTSLDEILAPTGGSASTKYIGQRVKRNTPTGQDGYGLFTCLQVYNRNAVDVALLQSLNGSAFIEWPVSDLTIVP